ncbi:MAG: DUF86 domain-containing protein [Hyphomicrobiales bacterium]|nr:DUF86 domain-containing protein [Hyphomicrobiales bacterium]MDE2018587.1 DUF86 domain-containing protein [Hyphomicrobiales bacterium]
MEFVRGFQFDDFVADRRTVYATTRALEIVSEAARRPPASLRESRRDLPWRAIMGAGNVYRHDYEDVLERAIWRAAREDVPSLLDAVESMIGTLDRAT